MKKIFINKSLSFLSKRKKMHLIFTVLFFLNISVGFVFLAKVENLFPDIDGNWFTWAWAVVTIGLIVLMNMTSGKECDHEDV